MSIHIVVFLNEIPPAKAWAAALEENEFAIKLNRSFDTTRQRGFVPSSYGHVPAGFEYYADPVEDYLDEVGEDFAEDEVARIRQFSYAIDFVTHSRFHDAIAAAIAAGVLAQLRDGLLLDCQTGNFLQSSEAVRWAREQEREFQPHLAEDEK